MIISINLLHQRFIVKLQRQYIVNPLIRLKQVRQCQFYLQQFLNQNLMVQMHLFTFIEGVMKWNQLLNIINMHL